MGLDLSILAITGVNLEGLVDLDWFKEQVRGGRREAGQVEVRGGSVACGGALGQWRVGAGAGQRVVVRQLRGAEVCGVLAWGGALRRRVVCLETGRR